MVQHNTYSFSFFYIIFAHLVLLEDEFVKKKPLSCDIVLCRLEAVIRIFERTSCLYLRAQEFYGFRCLQHFGQFLRYERTRRHRADYSNLDTHIHNKRM